MVIPKSYTKSIDYFSVGPNKGKVHIEVENRATGGLYSITAGVDMDTFELVAWDVLRMDLKVAVANYLRVDPGDLRVAFRFRRPEDPNGVPMVSSGAFWVPAEKSSDFEMLHDAGNTFEFSGEVSKHKAKTDRIQKTDKLDEILVVIGIAAAIVAVIIIVFYGDSFKF